MGKNDYINLDSTKQTIPAGSHTCLLYEDEAKKNEFILQFISTGIQKGEKVLCITDSLTREEILDSVGQDDYISGHVPHSGLIVTNTKNMYRSEEHTCELQSRPLLVCRLLLEK